MKRALLSIVGCLGTIGLILTTGRITNPDPAKVIPYPEVVNLKRVPIFNDKGIVTQAIAAKVLPPPKIVTSKLPAPSATKNEPGIVTKAIAAKVLPPPKIAASKLPAPSATKKVRQLILEHQKLVKIEIDR